MHFTSTREKKRGIITNRLVRIYQNIQFHVSGLLDSFRVINTVFSIFSFSMNLELQLLDQKHKNAFLLVCFFFLGKRSQQVPTKQQIYKLFGSNRNIHQNVSLPGSIIDFFCWYFDCVPFMVNNRIMCKKNKQQSVHCN